VVLMVWYSRGQSVAAVSMCRFRLAYL